MQAWHFSENPYPFLPELKDIESVRVSLPNKYYDPKIGADLYRDRIDEWVLAEELGMNIFINEHHQTATCLDGAAPVVLSIIAHETTSARLLMLGNPVAVRRDPVRVAEEMATIDVLSRGRLELGFVRGVGTEMAAANANPVGLREREWEAIDLIVKAMSSHDGPFNWEGKYFHNRQVNIWPRPWQDPHPPIWVATGTPAMAEELGERGYIAAVFLAGIEGARATYGAYRARREALKLDPPKEDRFAYLALLYTGDTDEEGREGAKKLMWYLDANKVAPQWQNPPGYTPPEAVANVLRRGPRPFGGRSIEQLIDQSIVFAGTPDTVYNQLKRFYDAVGGFGHLLIMGQAGVMGHEEVVKGMKLFSKEVLPRLSELSAVPVG